eukprot:Plantae.Rhodophyta-Purpureofilum_apyrenoidigerum.ctg23981.p1 GENE.Plantae.Rhodophyta-Purpureofilum_apyrenoidigerum.ctg23981~~Plantae.Rhodophyta-Purpureofilum_apyrenoidigerum.ctg23981.p1  ORF type:complete len:314 (-),score=53.96 Plantae.Rhodophyta-Purpureofilum_apyrenoidigerum.ctg23981:689-1630(-)
MLRFSQRCAVGPGWQPRAWMSSMGLSEKIASISCSSESSTVPLAFAVLPAKEEPRKQLPPIVLLHGLLGSQMTYRSLVKRSDFAPFRQVYAVDLRNHGQSPHVSDMDLVIMSRDVARFLDDEEMKQACIIGHSVGGKVAMILALEQPDRVSELVVMDIAPSDSRDRSNTIVGAVQAMHDIDLDEFQSRRDIDTAFQKHGIREERLRQFLSTNVVPNSQLPGSYKWKLHIEAIHKSLPALQSFPKISPERTYQGPSLFVYGEKSDMLGREDASDIRKKFPRATIRKISKAGHWLQADNPDEFCRALSEFLSSDE